MKPSSVLVTALQVHVTGRPKIVSLLKHRRVAYSGIKPDIKDIGLLLKISSTTGRAYSPVGKEIVRVFFKPYISAIFPDHGDNMIQNLFRSQIIPAIFAVKYRNGHSPRTLSRYAPVGPVFYHAIYTIAAP